MAKIAVCGGAYANPWALQSMLVDARSRGCERVFCLGDLGGFGADCEGVWQLLLDAGVECIAGNYDVAIGRGDPDCGCGYSDERDNHYAQLIYDYTLAHASRELASWMRTLAPEHRETIAGTDLHMVHGSPLAINDFMWESLSDEELEVRLAASGAQVLLCTHTGIPWQRRLGERLVVNVGAVGRPANDGRRETWYATLELEQGEATKAELIPVAYDWRAQAASMRAAGLPEPFVETIETGWWTTCLEIVPPRERARGRFHIYRGSLDADWRADGLGWAAPSQASDDERPVIELFGSAAFPPRLWLYTNFHCNLACDYCVVASSPRASRRSLGLPRLRALVDDAVEEGFRELYLTGGEPFLEPEIVAMLQYASERIDTVVLTNAMLFTGRRGRELARLVEWARDRPRFAGDHLAREDGRPANGDRRLGRLVMQTSLDGACAQTHDAWRGAGSFERTLEGIRYARGLGLALRVAMTETPQNREEVEPLRGLLAGLGIVGEDFAVRPLVRRGFAADRAAGMEVGDALLAPELTITADGAHWHPIGGDLASSPDMLLAPGTVSLHRAKQLVTERFLTLRQDDGTLPAAFRCAV
ncbi:MAG: radical SAM protein [Actinomycetota bacterium]|nr:radical SAM protein [Actinomycetota bacterium]